MKKKFTLSKDGYLIKKKLCDEEFLTKIKNELTVEPYTFGVNYGAKEKDNNFFKVYR